RNIKPALNYVDELTGADADISKAVEAGKKQFAGNELPGRTLGVVGLGAIGVEVCNAALALGMEVIGFDPNMTVARAWQLSAGVDEAVSIDHLLGQVDMLSIHVPLMDATRGLINAERLKLLPKHAVLLNMARGGVVDDDAVVAALDAGDLRTYVTDFPARNTIGHEKIVALPHLGASTAEAEDNCAITVAETVRDFLENGNIRHSVNFPDANLPRIGDATRVTIANKNVPNMVGQISTILADKQLNIADLLNKSRGELAYTIVDIDGSVDTDIVGALAAIDGVLNVRLPGASR
ncbi:MAG: phosphoglycerate dehydrogenase, partial [Pseudomonadota bacterium]